MSLGERRRVQILCSWLKAENGSDNLLYVLDECSTDLDVAERQAVLGRIRRETEEVKVIRFSANDSKNNNNKVNSDDGDVVYKGRGACLYATHIFDGLQGWATHVLYIRNGEIQSFESVEELTARTAKEGEVFSIEQYAHALLSQDYRYTERKGIVHDNSPFFNVYQNSQFSFREFEEMRDAIHHKKDLGDPTNSDSSNFIQLYKSIQNQRNYWEEGKAKGDNTVLLEFDHFSYKTILENVSFQIHTGERVLLSGCNGCGKTTLLNILGGKQCIYRNRPNGPNGTVKLFVKPTADDDGVYLYEDGMKYMHDNVAYGGDWWTRVPGGEVHVYQLLSQYVEYDDGEGRNPNTPYNVHAEKERQAGRYRMNSPRGDFLQHLLQVQLQWDIRKCSAGEVKRVLLLLVLLPDKRLVLLDEATADLDVHQRHALLLFLYLESAFRGVTVCYCTHIFGGLQSWASRLILLDRTQKGVVHEETQGDGGDIALDSVTTLLTQLKEKETF
ncbi:CCR4-NOT complex subunit CAF16 [Angomonas deanei]|uniref:ABC transporter, putative n=1 Tax=Angomonas deanei TaxID=59799 RepID=A0A7G2CH24_9TRYP|nr:CCR4-NOT complex subunit CAF16 [Angomonas deanei]CAD2218194.1 ABC transporter, putative [Angomonas deanei]|eukprot:EPY17015.1 CCR4-NOT complex subunit CAF16 [Angomonas deanei]